MEVIDLMDPKWKALWALADAVSAFIESPAFEPGSLLEVNTPWGPVRMDFGDVYK